MICVIDSHVANIASVLFALARLGVNATLTRNTQVIKNASHIILPGVGHASAAMAHLKTDELTATLTALTQPTLGICLGMQLLFSHSDEGNTPTLDLIPGNVTALKATALPLPHMGWNQLIHLGQHPLLDGISDNAYCYFVHSYAAPVGDYTLASCEYGQPFSAIVAKDNFYGCQFHPERSGNVGQRILANFLKLN